MHSRPNRQWKIGTVENCRHHWYLLIWIVYFVLFYIAEHVVTDHYWVSYLPLDDKIPFCRYFIIPYCMWHPLLFAMTLYLMWYDVPAFKRFMVYIGLGFGGSILFCLIFPNGQDLRPTEFAQHDFFIWLVQRIYTADTNTNVLPSMHVIGCAALTLACFDSEPLCRRAAAGAADLRVDGARQAALDPRRVCRHPGQRGTVFHRIPQSVPQKAETRMNFLKKARKTALFS